MNNSDFFPIEAYSLNPMQRDDVYSQQRNLSVIEIHHFISRRKATSVLFISNISEWAHRITWYNMIYLFDSSTNTVTLLLFWKPISNNITLLKYLTKAKICLKRHTQEIASVRVLHGKESIFTFWRKKLHFYSSTVLPLDSSQTHFVGFLFVLEVVSLLLLFLLCTNMDFCCKVVVSSELFIFMARNMRQPLQGQYIIISSQGEDKC